jgi:hypothetical protein
MTFITHTCSGYLADPPEIQQAIDDAGFWMGCEHPERPVDRFMLTIAGCRGCDIAEEVAYRTGSSVVNVDSLEGVLQYIGAEKRT